MTEESATEKLYDAGALWALWPEGGPNDVISAAVDALVAGVDSPALRELAGLWAGDAIETVRPLVEATFEELGLPYAAPGSDEAQIAAARVMGKSVLAGSLSARGFAAWAHGAIGHEGAAQLQSLVELDDDYEVLEYTGHILDELDESVVQHARNLLAGDPLPGDLANEFDSTLEEAPRTTKRRWWRM